MPDPLRSSGVPAMRIRRWASSLYGSNYSTPAAPPPALLAPPPIPEPSSAPLTSDDPGGFFEPMTTPKGLRATSPKGPCELSRSPWDLLDDLSLSNPQEVDDLLDSYYVNANSSACHLSSASMPVTSMKNKKTMAMTAASSERAQLQIQKQKTTLKKADMKENKGKTQKNAEGEEGAAQTWQCKKNDGKGWQCRKNANRPNSYCEHHLMKKRSHLNLERASPIVEDKVMVAAPTTASKPSSSSKAQKKKPANNYDAIEGFYYYNGFGPSRSKRSRNHPNKEEMEVEPSKNARPPSHAKADQTEDCTSNGATTGGDDVRSDNNSGRNKPTTSTCWI